MSYSNQLAILLFAALTLVACKPAVPAAVEYHDVQQGHAPLAPLFATAEGEELSFGSPVAYLNASGDTLIPFGPYAYFGTDTLKHYAQVLPVLEDGSFGGPIAIDREQHRLFDLVLYDNGPDYFQEGLTRVKRDGKMGFANREGQVVIPCIYAFAHPFGDGRAKVTLQAELQQDGEHTTVERAQWFWIDRKGNEIN